MNEASARSVLQAVLAWPAWLGWLVVILAFFLGMAADAAVSNHSINILAPPLMLVMLWNLAVYVFIGLHALRGLLAASPRTASLHTNAGKAALPAVARGTTVMHWAAAALASGALLAMYWRGLVFDYQALWQSTFLSPQTVHQILSVVLGPASWLSALWGGTALPDAQALAQLRYPASTGENAGRWIHWYAITVLLVVVLPRSVLAGWSALQAGRLARSVPAQAKPGPGQGLSVQALPFNYQLDADLQAGLQTRLRRDLHADIAMTGSLNSADAVVVIFPLTATPERETHGEFLQTTRQQCLGQRPPAQLLVWVDESGFKQRFQGGMLADRRAQRRQAWLALCPVAQFVDLRHPETESETATARPALVTP